MFPLTSVVRISLLYPRYFKTEAATQLGQSFSFGDFFHLLPFYSYYYSFLFVPMLVLPSLMLQMLSAFAVDVMGSLRGPHSALEAALGSSEIQFRFLDSAADSCGPFSPIPLHEFRDLAPLWYVQYLLQSCNTFCPHFVAGNHHHQHQLWGLLRIPLLSMNTTEANQHSVSLFSKNRGGILSSRLLDFAKEVSLQPLKFLSVSFFRTNISGSILAAQ